MKNVRKVHWVHDEILLNECRYRKTNESWSGPLLLWEAFIEINRKHFLGCGWKFLGSQRLWKVKDLKRLDKGWL